MPMNVLTSLVALLVVPPAAGAAPEASPAERRVIQARRAIESDPRSTTAHAGLALALARRARETGDPRFYQEALGALDAAPRAEPPAYELRKARAWVLLGQHRFEEAEALARGLLKEAPDDLQANGFLVDALAELGRYAEAEEVAQFMLDLRPGNLPGLTRGAYLRESFGDLDGALEFMEEALQFVALEEVEDRAWILTQIGHLHLAAGRVDAAERAALAALAEFPDYHYALAQLARVRAAQGRTAEAVALLERRFQSAPHPENRYELAEALARAGRKAEAQAAYAAFEAEARREMDGPDNANRELARYYAGPGKRANEALRIAEREVARRRDVATLDVHAWALHAAGRHAEGLAGYRAALAVGVKDAGILCRAGLVAVAAGATADARRWLEGSLRTNPSSEAAGTARQALDRLGGRRASR
jgi:tetratricopeptide (TPR) repeat protein